MDTIQISACGKMYQVQSFLTKNGEPALRFNLSCRVYDFTEKKATYQKLGVVLFGRDVEYVIDTPDGTNATVFGVLSGPVAVNGQYANVNLRATSVIVSTPVVQDEESTGQIPF